MKNLTRIYFLIFAIALVSISCSKKEFNNKDVERSSVDNAEPVDNSEDSIVETPEVDNRSLEEVLCQEGPELTLSATKVDFKEQFAIVCNGETTNEFFASLLQNAYQGEGTPKIEMVRSSISELFVANLAFAYAIKVNLADPSTFSDLEAHNIFAEGIEKDNSALLINVASRESFPGRASVEKVILDYNLSIAKGAAIHDVRQTEFNNYILKEDLRDVTVSTEHLLSENHDYYHSANGLTIGLKAENGQSYLIFVNEFIIKNRIDPKRLENTLISLNEQVATMLHTFVNSQNM
ncbi:MAG: hypothetical protein ACOH5I_08405 [Oligoflexus sp.]